MKSNLLMLSEAALNGEPCFVIRAKDALSLKALDAYLVEANNSACPKAFIEDVETIREEFHQWQTENLDKVKNPD